MLHVRRRNAFTSLPFGGKLSLFYQCWSVSPVLNALYLQRHTLFCCFTVHIFSCAAPAFRRLLLNISSAARGLCCLQVSSVNFQVNTCSQCYFELTDGLPRFIINFGEVLDCTIVFRKRRLANDSLSKCLSLNQGIWSFPNDLYFPGNNDSIKTESCEKTWYHLK